jgi:hypothetical protein
LLLDDELSDLRSRVERLEAVVRARQSPE